MASLTEQQEFDKIDLFLSRAKTKYSFELASYRTETDQPREWYASIQYHLYDDHVQVVGCGSTRLEAMQSLNNKLEADPTYETTDFDDPEFNHEG